MDRRQFVTSLGALVPALGALTVSTSVADAETLRSRVSLNGRWERHVNEMLWDHVEAPSSLQPSGFYRLRRTVLLPLLSSNQRAVIHFEAINYHGRVFLNGAEVGVTLPYVPSEFDITRHARAGSNTIEVAVADLCPEPGGAGGNEVWLGLTPGWEGYGGIIRDAWVEVRPSTFLENVRLVYRLGPQYGAAACRVTAWLSAGAADAGRCEIALLHSGNEVARVDKQIQIPQGTTPAEFELSIDAPALWSPADPHLYTLRATLHSAAGTDQWSCRAGFRDAAIRGRSFLLNGDPILLNGVCRFDLWKNQGMTLTRAQMEQDMRAIKAMGANFVRLVHYPHDRHIIELADELGLLVTEEPGYWDVDFREMSVGQAELGLRVMEQAVRRDWNSPSVFAWLLANESQVTVEYLRAGKAMLRDLDPQGRFVGLASSKEQDGTKALCDETGMDFYSDHPSVFDIDRYDAIAEHYGSGKPLLFTAWSGVVVGQADYTMPFAVDKLMDMTESGTLSGHCFWCWQDLPQFSRIDVEMKDGVQQSGVVTEDREPRRLIRMELSRLFEHRRRAGSLLVDAPASGPVMEPLRRAPWSPRSRIEPVDLTPLVSGDRGRRSGLETGIAAHWNPGLWNRPEQAILGVRFAVPLVDGAARPVVLTPDFPDVEIPIEKDCTQLHFLGQVQWGGGFPLEGASGESVGSYQIRYRNGQTRDIPLRAGFEVAAASTIYVGPRLNGSRTNPVATSAPRAFWYIKDWNSEHYHALLFSLPTESGGIASVRCHIHPGQHPLLLFAVFTESA